MNKQKWESLPADLQKIVTDVTEKHYEEAFAPFFDNINIKGMKWLKEKKDVEVIELSAEETAIWQEKLSPLEDQYIKFMDEKGLSGADIMKTVRGLIESTNADHPEEAVFLK